MTRSSPTYATCPTHMPTRPSLPTLCTLPRDLPYLPSPSLSLSPSPSPLSVQGAEFRVILCSSAGIRQQNTWRSMPLQIREPPLKPNLLLKKTPFVSTLSSFLYSFGVRMRIYFSAYLLLNVPTSSEGWVQSWSSSGEDPRPLIVGVCVSIVWGVGIPRQL